MLFLAAIYSVAGQRRWSRGSFRRPIVGVLHPWLAWRIANRLFGPTVGVASAVLPRSTGTSCYYSGALVTESLYIVAVLWAARHRHAR